MPVPPDPDHPVPPEEPPPWRRWIRRFGVAGFLFFLIKGLLWLTIPALLVALGVRC